MTATVLYCLLGTVLMIMKYSIWQINDKDGNKLGLLKTESWLDILDVTNRAKNMYGDDADWARPIYIGDID